MEVPRIEVSKVDNKARHGDEDGPEGRAYEVLLMCRI